MLRPVPHRLDESVLDGVLGRREVVAAADEDPDDLRHERSQEHFVAGSHPTVTRQPSDSH
jgi:hypothetical protein